MARRKKRYGKSAIRAVMPYSKSPARRMFVPRFFSGDSTAKRSGNGLRKMIPKPSVLFDNLLDGGAVAIGLVGGNAIRTIVPIKEPMIKAIINIISGIILTGAAGKMKRLSLVGAGIAGNGLLLATQKLFPNIPYLSGETLEITAQDVKNAMDTGAITQQEGAALLNTMAGEGDGDAELLGAMYEYAGESLENTFVTTQNY